MVRVDRVLGFLVFLLVYGSTKVENGHSIKETERRLDALYWLTHDNFKFHVLNEMIFPTRRLEEITIRP